MYTNKKKSVIAFSPPTSQILEPSPQGLISNKIYFEITKFGNNTPRQLINENTHIKFEHEWEKMQVKMVLVDKKRPTKKNKDYK